MSEFDLGLVLQVSPIFRSKFQEIYPLIICGELLEKNLSVSGKTT